LLKVALTTINQIKLNQINNPLYSYFTWCSLKTAISCWTMKS
jgi:hypothetical protein